MTGCPPKECYYIEMVSYLGADHLDNFKYVPNSSKLPENRSKIVGNWSTKNLRVKKKIRNEKAIEKGKRTWNQSENIMMRRQSETLQN